jgi:hypothetical protein
MDQGYIRNKDILHQIRGFPFLKIEAEQASETLCIIKKSESGKSAKKLSVTHQDSFQRNG